MKRYMVTDKTGTSRSIVASNWTASSSNSLECMLFKRMEEDELQLTQHAHLCAIDGD